MDKFFFAFRLKLSVSRFVSLFAFLLFFTSFPGRCLAAGWGHPTTNSSTGQLVLDGIKKSSQVEDEYEARPVL